MLALIVALVAAAQPGGNAAEAARGASASPFKVVLVAGDGEVPAFDNAADRFELGLETEAGVPAGDISRLSAARSVWVGRDGVEPATRSRVLAAIEAMRPEAGQGCLVFATSHGVEGEGLYLAARNEVLDPAALDRALQTGCGNAPTVVIISACYSGSFARPPMTRPNRVVLTAARADRSSFGCGADDVLTDYDGCLLGSLRVGGTWRDVYDRVRPCVGRLEQQGRFLPSQPQAWFGAGVSEMAAPAFGG